MSSRRYARHLLTALLVPTVLVACSDDSTGPDTTAEAMMSARIEDGSSSSALTSSPTAASSLVGAAFNGTAHGRAHVEVYSEANGWVSLGSPSNASMTLQSANGTTVHSDVTVDPGIYTRVRLVLENFDADIAAGAVLGGLTLNSAVTIDVGGSDDRVVIEKEVSPVLVEAETRSTIVFDLNSEAWVTSQSAQNETASDAEVASATRATVERM